MRDRIDIDHTHSQAISQEIGERLQAFLGKSPEPEASFRKKIEFARRVRGAIAANRCSRPKT